MDNPRFMSRSGSDCYAAFETMTSIDSLPFIGLVFHGRLQSLLTNVIKALIHDLHPINSVSERTRYGLIITPIGHRFFVSQYRK